ncbi:MAG: hypothetical protein K2Q03_09870 [Sphingobacteriaceae bacterium]|nr:hypothetical protein [Sphingobacteriaceae bacterium]
MKRLSLFLLMSVVVVFAKAQTSVVDTIYSNNEKIACSVKEITDDAVKYIYVGEDLLNTLNKNAIQKIVFKSGRVQKFANSTAFKQIKSVEEYEKVSISQVESEVKGLFKIGEVTSKAVGSTTMSSMQNVRDRAYTKIKIEAAMRGANAIYLTQQNTTDNQPGNYFTPAKATETNLSGIAYSSVVPNFEEFKALIKDKKEFNAARRFKLWTSSFELKEEKTKSVLKVADLIFEEGTIYIIGVTDNADAEKFKVVYFDNETFTIMYQNKSSLFGASIYNEQFKW